MYWIVFARGNGTYMMTFVIWLLIPGPRQWYHVVGFYLFPCKWYNRKAVNRVNLALEVIKCHSCQLPMKACTLQPQKTDCSPDCVHLCPRGGDVFPLRIESDPRLHVCCRTWHNPSNPVWNVVFLIVFSGHFVALAPSSNMQKDLPKKIRMFSRRDRSGQTHKVCLCDVKGQRGV